MSSNKKYSSNTKKGEFTAEEMSDHVKSQYEAFPYPTAMPMSHYLTLDQQTTLSPGCPIEMSLLANFNPSKKLESCASVVVRAISQRIWHTFYTKITGQGKTLK